MESQLEKLRKRGWTTAGQNHPKSWDSVDNPVRAIRIDPRVMDILNRQGTNDGKKRSMGTVGRPAAGDTFRLRRVIHRVLNSKPEVVVRWLRSSRYFNRGSLIQISLRIPNLRQEFEEFEHQLFEWKYDWYKGKSGTGSDISFLYHNSAYQRTNAGWISKLTQHVEFFVIHQIRDDPKYFHLFSHPEPNL